MNKKGLIKLLISEKIQEFKGDEDKIFSYIIDELILKNHKPILKQYALDKKGKAQAAISALDSQRIEAEQTLTQEIGVLDTLIVEFNGS